MTCAAGADGPPALLSSPRRNWDSTLVCWRDRRSWTTSLCSPWKYHRIPKAQWVLENIYRTAFKVWTLWCRTVLSVLYLFRVSWDSWTSNINFVRVFSTCVKRNAQSEVFPLYFSSVHIGLFETTKYCWEKRSLLPALSAAVPDFPSPLGRSDCWADAEALTL